MNAHTRPKTIVRESERNYFTFISQPVQLSSFRIQMISVVAECPPINKNKSTSRQIQSTDWREIIASKEDGRFSRVSNKYVSIAREYAYFPLVARHVRS